MPTRWIPFLIFVMLYAFPTSAQWWEVPADICGADDTVTPTETIILADMQAIDAGNPFILMDRSPSCRYVIAMFQGANDPEFERLFVMWDMNTGSRLFEFARTRVDDREVPFFQWNSERTEVVVGGWSHRGYLHDGVVRLPMNLLKLPTLERIDLFCDIETTHCVIPSSKNIYWDNNRNWLFMAGSSGIVAFDRNTGQAVRLLLNPPWWRLFSFYTNNYFLSDDDSFAVVYDTDGTVDSLTVWDINSYQSYPVNVDGFVPYYRCYDQNTSSVALSPDNRYLAIGFRAIRIWDLQNLEPAYEDRFPLYRHEGPIAKIACLHFVDNTTIETSSAGGVQRWDLHTGELIDLDATGE